MLWYVVLSIYIFAQILSLSVDEDASGLASSTLVFEYPSTATGAMAIESTAGFGRSGLILVGLEVMEYRGLCTIGDNPCLLIVDRALNGTKSIVHSEGTLVRTLALAQVDSMVSFESTPLNQGLVARATPDEIERVLGLGLNYLNALKDAVIWDYSFLDNHFGQLVKWIVLWPFSSMVIVSAVTRIFPSLRRLIPVIG